MSAQPTERVDLDIIEALDFDHTPPCEHSEHDRAPHWHDGPAWALILNDCPGCGHTRTFYLCQKAWTVKGSPFEWLHHSDCGWRGRRDDVWLILALVGSTS